MEMNEKIIRSQTNTQSILSLAFGTLTLLSFCMGVFPIPFTGFVCFPASLVFGSLALIFGALALNQIRRSNETGSPMAWAGIAIGGFVFICLMCMMIAFASLFIFAPNYVPSTPFFNNHQL
jgi:hypothetical protein